MLFLHFHWRKISQNVDDEWDEEIGYEQEEEQKPASKTKRSEKEELLVLDVHKERFLSSVSCQKEID